jgi:HEAT repeat protein
MDCSLRSTLALLGLLACVAPAPAQTTGRITSTSPDQSSEITEVGGKTLKQWIKDTKHPHASVREKACRVIRFFGKAAQEEAGPALTDRLIDSDTSVRTNAVITLGILVVADKDVPKAVQALGNRVVRDSESQAIVRYHATYALARYGTHSKPAIRQLLTATQDPSSYDIRKGAIYALGVAAYDKKGPDMQVVRPLLRCLDDKEPDVRMETLAALVGFGKPAAPMDAQFLANFLRQRFTQERDEQVLIWLHLALMVADNINDKELGLVAKYLKNKDTAVREQAAFALGMFGEKAKTRASDLIDALRDPEPEVILAAGTALLTMGEGYKGRVADALIDLQKREGIAEPIKKAIVEAADKIRASKSEK